MGNRKKEIDETVNSFNKESFIIENFRMILSYKIKYNGRFFHCFRVERLIKSILFSRSWIDSSSKSDPPPDFHNEKHHIMMEIMRVDDGAGGKHSPNSFERKEKYMQKHYGKDYKKMFKGCSLYFTPDTRNDLEYNFKSYLKNFDRVVTDHSNKVDNYHQNYPKCKTCVFLIFDESNAYYQKTDNSESMLLHQCFYDLKFVEIIKRCNADYVIWFTFYKTVFDKNSKEIKQPYAVIYDVKRIKQNCFEYNHEKMIKVK